MENYEFNKVDFDYDNDYVQAMVPIMIRQKHKTQLLLTTNFQLENLSKDTELYGRKYKKVQKDILKDYFAGVKMINKKNPVFIEMPSLVEEKQEKSVKKVYNKKLKTDNCLPDTKICAIEDKTQ